MPVVPAATINDLPKSERKKARELMYERAVLQYYFSYDRLIRGLTLIGVHTEAANSLLRDAICAFTDDEVKKVKEELNDKIATLFTNNGIDKTLRFEDPFARPKDYCMYEGVATSFSQNRALPLMVAGVYQWECPECLQEVFSCVPVCSMCKHKLVRFPRAAVKHTLPAEAVTAAFEAATVKTKYVTVQAREVKDDNGKAGK